MILNSLCDTDAESGLGPIENIEMWIPGSIENQYGVKSSYRYNLLAPLRERCSSGAEVQ